MAFWERPTPALADRSFLGKRPRAYQRRGQLHPQARLLLVPAAADRVGEVRPAGEVALQARLTEMTAQRDRWEQRFDQLKLPAVNTGERRPWWRRLVD
jgi:hypothetical protein